MSQPGFRSPSSGIAFFSRGRGHVHALQDAAVIKELSDRSPDSELVVLSYATGFETLGRHADWGPGVRGLINLELPEEPFGSEWYRVEALRREAELINALQPRLVVSHEEFAALAAAKVYHLPTLFLTDWFAGPGAIETAMLNYADHTVFLDEEGLYDEPSSAQGKVSYVGPILRDSGYTAADRSRARGELGLEEAAFVISVWVAPGRRTEYVAPIFDLVVAAFSMLPIPDKRLFWVTTDDFDELSRRTKEFPGIEVLPEDTPFDRLMAASDFAVTKGNRNIVLELERMEVPSVSLTHWLNSVDDFRTERTSTNRTLPADQTDSQLLLKHMSEMTSPEFRQAIGSKPRDGRAGAADRILEFLRGL